MIIHLETCHKFDMNIASQKESTTMAMILPHSWKLLKFPDVIPSFCCLASWRLASIFRAAMFLLRVLFLCYPAYSVSPHHFLLDCKSESTRKHQDSVLHSLPWAHQLWHEAWSHLLQTVLGSLQLICSCWEERLEGISVQIQHEAGDEEKQLNQKKGLFRQNGRFQLVQKVHSPSLTQSKLCQLHLTELTPDPSWVGGFFIFWRPFL